MLGAGPAGSVALPPTPPPSPSAVPEPPLSQVFLRLIPGCTAPCFWGAGVLASVFGALCGKSLRGAPPPIGQRLFQKPTWFYWVQPAPFPRSPSPHFLGRESISACLVLSPGGPRPLLPAQEWECGAQRPRPSAGIREDQVSNILLVRTQGVLVPEPGWEANADVAPVPRMGAPALQIF